MVFQTNTALKVEFEINSKGTLCNHYLQPLYHKHRASQLTSPNQEMSMIGSVHADFVCTKRLNGFVQ